MATITLKAAHLASFLHVLQERQASDSSVSNTMEFELVEATDELGKSDYVNVYAQSFSGTGSRHFLGTTGKNA